MAEGVHQIVQGNFERAAAAMAVADKQSLPDRAAGHDARRAAAPAIRSASPLLCPVPSGAWPQDRRSHAEPAVNAWIAHMLGDPSRYRFTARVHRGVDAQTAADP